MFQKQKQKFQKLQKRQHSKNLVSIKNQQDAKNYYKYREDERLKRVHSGKELLEDIKEMVRKSQKQQLSFTEKFILSGYISTYIKQRLHKSEEENISQKIYIEFLNLSQVWFLFRFKLQKCDKYLRKQKEDKVLFLEFEKINQSLQKGKMTQTQIYKAIRYMQKLMLSNL